MRTEIPTFKKADGTKARDAKDKAQTLNVIFGSAYQQECNIIPPVTKNYNGIPLCSIKITDEKVMDKLKSLNPGKSTSPDGWHPYLLLCLADELYVPLGILYNKSLIEGVVPSQWLESCITAIHKKDLRARWIITVQWVSRWLYVK